MYQNFTKITIKIKIDGSVGDIIEDLGDTIYLKKKNL